MNRRDLIIGAATAPAAMLIHTTEAQAQNGGYQLNLPWGYLLADNNEVHIISTVDDPPKVRQAASHGIALGAWSFGRLRADGRQEEVVLFQGKMDERFRDNPTHYSGEFTLHIRDGNDPDADRGMRKIFQMRHDGVEFYVPVKHV